MKRWWKTRGSKGINKWKKGGEGIDDASLGKHI